MKNPLIKRLPREFTGEIAKYIVIFIFMTAVIGLISGFLIADGSVLDTYNKSFDKYNVEDFKQICFNEMESFLLKNDNEFKKALQIESND